MPRPDRSHVDHFVSTLDDPVLADQLTLLQLTDANELEDVLRARERAKARQPRSSEHRSQVATARAARVCQLQGTSAHNDQHQCSKCGSRKHSDRGCWKRVTCQQCGKNGHPSDRCFLVCRGCREIHDVGKCQLEELYNLVRQWFDPSKHPGILPDVIENMLRRGCSSTWNPRQPDTSASYIYAFVEKQSQDQGSYQNAGRFGDLQDLQRRRTAMVASLRSVDEYQRSEVAVTLDLLLGETRGYWKHHSPGKHFKQAESVSKINHIKAVVMLDSGSEVSSIDTSFAQKAGCYIDTNQSQECLGIGEKRYVATGRTRIKLTLAEKLLYYYDVWVGDDMPSDYQAILGMDFMVPAGIWLDLGNGVMCLPDEIRVPLHGRRQLFSDRARPLQLDRCVEIAAGMTVELPVRLHATTHEKLWLTRGMQWIPTLAEGPGKLRYLRLTNIGDSNLVLQRGERVGLQLDGDHVVRQPGFVFVGS